MATECTSSQPGCTQIYCQPGLLDPGSLYIAASPSGSGGMALNCNFQTIQYRQPKCSYTELLDPDVGDDFASSYCVGSRWLNVVENPDVPNNQQLNKMWICVDNLEADAEWVPWLRWWNPDAWKTGDQQETMLMVDTHFACDSEYRRVWNGHPAAGAQLILVPQNTGEMDGAVVLGITGSPPGGDQRGASAVDFQNSREIPTQVANGSNSFIAGGANNRAGAVCSFAEGAGSVTGDAGTAAHAEGFADSVTNSTKQAGGVGSHAEGSAMQGGTITATDMGSHAEGYAYAGTISATAAGAHAEGQSYGQNGLLNAEGQGAHCEGYADASTIQAVGYGAHAEGSSANSSEITAGDDGSHAQGSADNSGQLLSLASGSHVGGSADGGIIQAQNQGAHATGVATAAGTIDCTGSGAHAQGSADGPGAELNSGGTGSHAEGSADGGIIDAGADGAHAEGYAATNSTIQASAAGAHGEGSAAMRVTLGPAEKPRAIRAAAERGRRGNVLRAGEKRAWSMPRTCGGSSHRAARRRRPYICD